MNARRRLAIFLLLPSSVFLSATEPPSPPILRIEAGMHTATIGRIATDAAGRVALTCSADKARLWSLEKGREGTLLRTLRVPIGEGNEGKLYACALSPDGKLAAVGGWTSADGLNTPIYLFDTASGGIVRVFAGLPIPAFAWLSREMDAGWRWD